MSEPSRDEALDVQVKVAAGWGGGLVIIKDRRVRSQDRRIIVRALLETREQPVTTFRRREESAGFTITGGPSLRYLPPGEYEIYRCVLPAPPTTETT